MVCRVCGCTNDNGCLVDAEGGVPDVVAIFQLDSDEAVCWWVESDLCSGCAYGITIRGPVVGVSTR